MRTKTLDFNYRKFIKDLNTQNDMKKWRQNKNKCRTSNKYLWHHFKIVVLEYCTKTSIHGVQYLAEVRPLKEKLFWFGIFIISIYCSSHLIKNVYDKWNETPVIVSFSEKTTPVWNIPFPAITICSEIKISKTEGLSYGDLFGTLKSKIKAKQYSNAEFAELSDVNLKKFLTLLHICNTQLIDGDIPRLYTRSIDFYNILDEMAPTFERFFYYCKWFSHFGECNDLFTKTYTEEGICYTFNGLNNTDLYRDTTHQYHRAIETCDNNKSKNIITNRTLKWSLEDGYQKDSSVHTYPARVLSAGSRAGLFIALKSYQHDIDYSCRGPIQGFKILLHSPDDVPKVSKQFIRIPMSKEVLIVVKPNMITTSEGIADYPPHRRQCYLSRERKLKFFKIYTQGNCELECLTNFTLHKCGCVKFSMPHTPDMPICREDKIHCYDKAEDDLLLQEFTEGSKATGFNYRGETKCNCLPACTSLVYNVEISQADFNINEVVQSVGTYESNSDMQMSRLSIYFKENQFITSKRSELYGITDFLANCGGIFSLFVGCSIVSLIELMYHFTLRLWEQTKN